MIIDFYKTHLSKQILTLDRFINVIKEMLRKSENKQIVFAELHFRLNKLREDRDYQDTAIKFTLDDLKKVINLSFPDDEALKKELEK